MRIAVPFGQYVPVDSPVHALEPRAKMGVLAAFVAALFASEGWFAMAACAAFLVLAVALARVPVRVALRGLRAVAVLLAFTLAAQALRWEPATVSLLRLGPLAVDAGGLARGAYFAARIVLLVVGSTLMTLTTTPVALTEAIERLLKPLALLRVPVGDLATMLSIALRFIPTTAEEAEKIIVAQAARGARFGSGGPVSRARAYLPVLVPLFVNLFRRADELASAMEARCYRGGEGRTRLRESKMRPGDVVTLGVCGALMAVIAVWL